MARPRTHAHVRGGLTRRTAIASILLSVVIGAAFAVLVLAIHDLRDAFALASRSRHALIAADEFETLVLGIEAGERGFVITGDASFLKPWYEARARFPRQAAAFERRAHAVSARHGAWAGQVVNAAESYVRDYSVPTVAAARRDLESVQTVAVTEDGRHRISMFQGQVAQFVALESQFYAVRRGRATTDTQRATIAAVGGVAGSMSLILASGGYLTRAVIRPVRRASEMAETLAGGDLAVRMPETGPGEIGKLEVAFNTMAGSLQANRDELRRFADEQAALRRVATVVARGVSPSEAFNTVAAEMGRLLRAACAAVLRYEPDGTATVVGSWSDPGAPERMLPLGSRWPLLTESVSAEVLRTGRPARVSALPDLGSEISEWARRWGIGSAVASPIGVEGRLWGAMSAYSASHAPLPAGAEERMLDFTELTATAIANAQNRAELAASRARIVAAADDARRRVERDLHDGSQQRLVSLTLGLRAAEADVPPGQEKLKQQLSHTVRGLADVLEELQEISRGLHPAILSQGGLGPALRTLARRSPVPVNLTTRNVRRLGERVEVAAYYAVSEALTNAAKHAHASVVQVDLTMEDTVLRLVIRDDGVGGADPGRGSGLIGLRDRLETLGGQIEVASPPGRGTSLLVSIPIDRD